MTDASDHELIPTRSSLLGRLRDWKDEASWQEEWQSNLLATARTRVKRRVSGRQFQIFDLHVLQQWPVAEVARTLKVSAAHVYLAKHRVGALLRQEVCRLERDDAWIS